MDPDDRARVIAYMNMAEGRGPVPLLDDAAILDTLRSARRIAVVGASSNPARPSNDVMRTLLGRGYECVPINPGETSIHGIPAYPTVVAATEANGRFDIVDVFRRPDACPPHAEDAVAAGAGCLWLQLGVVSWEAARIAADGGLAVVMDRCTAIEDRRLRMAGG